MTEYEYQGRKYVILFSSKMKIGQKWIPVLIYKCLYDNPDGSIWVREEGEFWRLFKEVNDENRDSKE